MAIRHDQGIVLRTYSFGEADKIVVLLSPNTGKIRSVAKGVRKTKSRFGGRLEPFTHVDLVLYEGRNLDTITQVSVIEAYPKLRADYDRVLVAGAMAEVADAMAQENESSAGLFLLLSRGLGTLEHDAHIYSVQNHESQDQGARKSTPTGSDLLSAFLLKAAAVLGSAPSFERCAGCGRVQEPSETFRFSYAAGGSVCSTCAPSGAYLLRDGVVSRLAALASADLRALPDLNDGLGSDCLGVARRFIEYHLERRLVSLEVMHD